MQLHQCWKLRRAWVQRHHFNGQSNFFPFRSVFAKANCRTADLGQQAPLCRLHPSLRWQASAGGRVQCRRGCTGAAAIQPPWLQSVPCRHSTRFSNSLRKPEAHGPHSAITAADHSRIRNLPSCPASLIGCWCPHCMNCMTFQCRITMSNLTAGKACNRHIRAFTRSLPTLVQKHPRIALCLP